MNIETLFCPQCDTFLHTTAVCPHCHWQRPPDGSLGEAVGEPLPLGCTVSGPPVVGGGKIWYAAPPTERETAGELLAVAQNGRLSQRFPLTDLARQTSLPVALGLADGGHHLLVGLLDYSLNLGAPARPLLALDPISGAIAEQIPTQSRELGTPVVADGYACFVGVAQDALYTFNLESRQLNQIALKVNSRYQPAVTAGVIIVVAGSFMSASYLLALDSQTGQELWRKEAARGFGQPVAADGVVYIPWDNSLRACDARSGAEIWRYGRLRLTSRGLISAPPRLHDDWLLVPGGGPDPQQRESYGLHALHRATGQAQWVFPIPQPGPGHHIMVTPAVFDDSVLIGEQQGDLYALHLPDGEPQWQAHLPRRLAAPPVADGATLLLPARDGYLYRRRWRSAISPPPLPAAVYAERGEWATAVAAHLLAAAPNYEAAATGLLRLGQAERARQLFHLAANPAGEAEALAHLGRYDEAITLYPADKLPPRQKADWLSRAGRPGEAADLYESLAQQPEEWLLAAQAHEQAKRPLKAIEAYKKAGQQAEVDRLAVTLDLPLLDKARGLIDWRSLVKGYKKVGHLTAAADLLEQNGARDEALALHQQANNWGRVRELCQQAQDWAGEAAACEKLAEQGETAGTERNRQGWWLAAGQLYAQHQHWADAERCFGTARHYGQWAAALAAQGQWVAAAELLCRPESRDYATAADYFWQAAETAVTQKPEWEEFNPEAAGLYERAEEYFALVGDGARLRQAQQAADRCRKRPRPELTSAHIAQPFQQGFIAAVQLRLGNVGFAPARQVQLLAYGLPLERPQRENAVPVGDPLPVLAAGATQELTISLEPRRASAGDTPIEFCFYLAYLDGAEMRETEKFGLVTAVYPNYVDMAKELAARGGPVSVTLNMSQGDMYTIGGDAVVMERRTAVLPTQDAAPEVQLPHLRSESEVLPSVVAAEGETAVKALLWVDRCPHCNFIVGGCKSFCPDCGQPVQPIEQQG